MPASDLFANQQEPEARHEGATPPAADTPHADETELTATNQGDDRHG
jgi:hypothetical protein